MKTEMRKAPAYGSAGLRCKIRAGKIHEIEAMGFRLPHGPKTGWE
jgi:hypothetical protein